MNAKTAHEPEAEVMSATDVLEDAQELGALLQSNLAREERVVRLEIPFSILLSALDHLSRDELTFLQKRLTDRLAG